MNCSFQGHKGQLDTKSGQVTFYNLVFDDIFHAMKFLIRIEPGEYTGWVIQQYFGVYDHNKKMYFTPDEGWVPCEDVPRFLMGN